MAVSPKTYNGYDSNNQHVVTVTARNATDYINPQEVATAIEKVKTVATEEIGIISNSLGKLTEDANDAIIVQGTKMTGTFEEIITGIKTIPDQIAESLAELKTIAQQQHDELQNQFNETAKAACYQKGAVTIR